MADTGNITIVSATPTAPPAPAGAAGDWSAFAPVSAAPAAAAGGDWSAFAPVQSATAQPAAASPSLAGSFGSFANHMVTDIPIVGPLIQDATDWGIGALQAPFTGTSPGDFVKHEQDYRAAQNAANPIAATTGNLAGNAAAMSLMGGTTLGAQALGLVGDMLPRMASNATTYTTLQAGDNMARGEAPAQAVTDALTEGPQVPFTNITVPGPIIAALMPAAAEGARGLVSSATTSPVARALARQFSNDQIEPASIPQRIQDMGPGAVIGDLGPNLQARTAAIATMPGEGRQTIVDALMSRRAASSDRIPQAIEQIAGAEPVPSQVEASIRGAKDTLDPLYQQQLQGWARDPNAVPLDMPRLADQIDTMINGAKGPSATALERVRGMLNLRNAPDTLDPRPEGLLATRKAIGGMLDGETNTDVIRNLTRAYNAVDDTLAASIPGIKAVDARFAELSRLQSDFDTGRTALHGGATGAPMHPDDLAQMMQNTAQNTGRFIGPASAPSPGPRFIAGGMLSKIYEIVGNNANDRVALRKILTGEGKWNYQKIAAAFGDDRAQQLLNLFRNESTMAETENLALQNSKTGLLNAAHEEDRVAASRPSVVGRILNFRAGDIYDSAKERLLGHAFAERQSAVNAEVARALMSRSLSPKIAAQIGRLNAPASPAIQQVGTAMLLAHSR